VTAGNELAGGDPAYLAVKQLRVEYTVGGVPRSAVVTEGSELRLPREDWTWFPPAPRISYRDGAPRLLAWSAGRCTLRIASGEERSVDVAGVPGPIEVDGPWDVAFPAGGGAPAGTAGNAPGRAVFETLLSWPDHEDAGIRHFSGTATYRTTLDIPAGLPAEGRELLLDLGRVEVMAAVTLNGKDLGVLWKEPYRVDVSQTARPGTNELEVRVTNLWPNRLIGDEQHPDDCEWNGIAIRRWPDWLVAGGERPVEERLAFTTWKHWKAGDPLLPSGLIGPVVLWTGVWMDVK